MPDPRSTPLSELRFDRSLTQLELAIRLRMPQSSVSRIEGQDDILVSTLARYIDALDGQLRLSARFGDDEFRIYIPSMDRPRNFGIEAHRRRARHRVSSMDPLEPSGFSRSVPPPGPAPTDPDEG
ncbi:MAG: helix-turn-helix protein [Actinomycetia bacterium]|nr:helix-turn-helix protein [Actinomycetes bacterium]